MTRVAFVCVGNAGRSQMATAFAERERTDRNIEDSVVIVTGGIEPRDHVHDDVVEVLREAGIDIGDRKPRKIAPEDVEDADYVVTMGCSIDQFRPEGWSGESRRWDLDHPSGDSIDAVRQQRDEIARRVSDFFDELEAEEGNSSDN